MDRLHTLVNSLKNVEQRQFRKYIVYKNNISNRKDLKTFNYECGIKPLDSNKKVKLLYDKVDNDSINSYRMLRVRVKEGLENFIFQQAQKDDTAIFINKQIEVARFLYFRKKYDLSWVYIRKAERTAIKAEQFELLNQIYQYMIEFAWTHPSNILNEIIEKEKANREQAQITRSMNLALSVIHSKLKVYHNKGKKADIQNIVKETLKKFNVEKVVAEKASERYKLAMLVKVSLEEENNYKELYQYMIDTIQEMEEAKMFTKYNYRNRIDLLNIVSYTASRAGDFATAEKYIKIIEDENKVYPETDLLSIQSFMTKAICLGLKNQITEALQVLEYLQNKYKNLYRDDDYFFVTMNWNLTSVNLHLGDVNYAMQSINELLSHQKRIKKQAGLNGLFYTHVAECILAVEQNKIDYAESRILSIERKYKHFLKQPYNTRNSHFIQILKTIIKDPMIWEGETFKKNAWSFIMEKIDYKPGLEFISFNAWLYSKLGNVAYNELGCSKMLQKMDKKVLHEKAT